MVDPRSNRERTEEVDIVKKIPIPEPALIDPRHDPQATS